MGKVVCGCTHQLGEDVGSAQEVPTLVLTGGNNAAGPDETSDVLHSKRSPRVRRNKRDDALRDQQSTGRKRAAKLYPFLDKDGNVIKESDSDFLERTLTCEWAGRRKVGGGKAIDGCGLDGRPIGKVVSRHHGPDKNTLNNEEGNVHRICDVCHNRWHAANDKDYDPNKPLKD